MPSLSYESYLKVVEDVLTKGGLSKEQSEAAARVMRFADFRGIESHGMILLNTYIDRIKEKIINKQPHYQWVLDQPSLAVLDGDKGMGHFLGEMAMNKAIKKAEDVGVGIVFVRNATHYGASGYYTNMAAEKGKIGFSTTNTFPLMAPTGGAERILGNNPISYSIPRSEADPLILDIASSVVAAGKLLVAESKNEKIPEGWAIDKDGNPTTDPHAGYLGGGSLLPVGNHKGYGLSLIMDVMAGVLSGSGYGTKVDHSRIGFVMMAINVGEVIDKKQFNANVDELTEMVVNSKRAPGVEKIFLPGEIEQEENRYRTENGFIVSENLEKELTDLMEKLGLDLKTYQ